MKMSFFHAPPWIDLREVDHRKTPVTVCHVEGEKENVVGEYVDLVGPVTDALAAAWPQLGEEEGGEGVD